MLNKQTNAVSGTIKTIPTLDIGDTVRLKFDPGLYGVVSKKGLVDQRNGQPLIEVTWFLQFNQEKEEIEAINPIAGVHSREALSLLTKVGAEKQ